MSGTLGEPRQAKGRRIGASASIVEIESGTNPGGRGRGPAPGGVTGAGKPRKSSDHPPATLKAVGLHTCHGTVVGCPDVSPVLDLLHRELGLPEGSIEERFDSQGRACPYNGAYARSAGCEAFPSLLVAWGALNGKAMVHVQLPGAVADALGTEGLVALWDKLRLIGTGLRMTRLDVYMDWEGGPSLVDICADLIEEYRRGGDSHNLLRSRSRQCKPIVECGDRAGRQAGEQGSGILIGSRESEKSGRVYDRRGHCRQEVELKRDQATRCLQMIRLALRHSGPLQAQQVMISAVRSLGDWIERCTDEAHRSRASLARWWSNLVEGTSVARLASPLPSWSRARAARWIARQVMPCLVALHQAADNILEEICAEWLERLRSDGDRLADKLKKFRQRRDAFACAEDDLIPAIRGMVAKALGHEPPDLERSSWVWADPPAERFTMRAPA